MTDTKPSPVVSVIVPVYQDPEHIRICVEGLLKQTYPKEKYEVIVVDNGGNGDLSFLNRESNVRVVIETKPGSYAARNKGVHVAHGDILAFTDADCIPQPSWLEKGVAMLLKNPHCGSVGGDIEFVFHEEEPNLFEVYESSCLVQTRSYMRPESPNKFAPTANMFTRQSVFKKVGLFNVNVKSGGDSDWGKRVGIHGFSVLFAPDAIVQHSARHTLFEIYRKIRRIWGGLYVLRYQRLPYPWFWRAVYLDTERYVQRTMAVECPSRILKLKLVLLEYAVQVVRLIELTRLRLFHGEPTRA